MNRIFIFTLPDLTFDKSDLNVPFSERRSLIGQLSLSVTNILFLSHKLRKNITIRFFIQKPIQHIIEIKTDTIRYLGPEERSFASIIHKAELFLSELLRNHNLTKSVYEPNPGVKLLISADIFIDLQQLLLISTSFITLSNESNDNNKDENDFQELAQFEKRIMSDMKTVTTFVFSVNLTENIDLDLKSNSNQNVIFLKLNKNNLARNVGLINVLLDKLENEKPSC